MSAVGRGEEGVGQKDLTVLTPPDKVGFTLAAALLVHLEAVYRDGVGVYFATCRALDFESVEKGRVFRVVWAEVGDSNHY